MDNLKVEMLRHDFLFGAQIFLLGGFKTEEENRLYEKHFLELFNFATVPFYWNAYEQKDGVYQFAKDVSAQAPLPPPFAGRNRRVLQQKRA